MISTLSGVSLQSGEPQPVKGRYPKKNPFFWDIFPKCVFPPTHPRVFVRFGKMKGEIRVEKGDFRGDLRGSGPCLGIPDICHERRERRACKFFG